MVRLLGGSPPLCGICEEVIERFGDTYQHLGCEKFFHANCLHEHFCSSNPFRCPVDGEELPRRTGDIAVTEEMFKNDKYVKPISFAVLILDRKAFPGLDTHHFSSPNNCGYKRYKGGAIVDMDHVTSKLIMWQTKQITTDGGVAEGSCRSM